MARTARQIAGEGYLVVSNESYHEYEPVGTALPYNTEGTDRGNAYKIQKTLAAYDADARAVLDFMKAHAQCNGRLGCFGMCLGGHLAARCALFPDVSATGCFFATDIHKHSLSCDGDDTLERLPDIKGEVVWVWGRQDTHVDRAGREAIKVISAMLGSFMLASILHADGTAALFGG